MTKKGKKISEFYEVICDEGTIKYEDFKKAEEKVKRLYQSESFGYLVKKEIDETGKILSELFVG
jgi:hypothetical protein